MTLELQTASLRRFNRTFTPRIGVLEESFLGTGRPFGPSRVLFEVGAEGCGVRELRERLGLDSGYLSRLLRSLEDEGLVEVAVDPADRRRRVARLTRRGAGVRRRLDARSEARARSLLEPLTEGQRRRLTDALATAELLIRAGGVVAREVDPASPPAQAAMRAFFEEIDARFPDGFDPGDALTADAPGMRPPTGTFLALTSDGASVAGGGLRRLDDATAEVKRMWVDPAWRGAGLGSRLLHALEAAARDRGYRTVRLDTRRILTEAMALYARAGYREIPRYNDNPYAQAWFEKPLP